MRSYLTLGELSKAVELYFTSEDPKQARDYIAKCILQPERLNPEDQLFGNSEELISDSPNPENK